MFSLHLGILFAFSTVLAEVPQKPKPYITAPSPIMKSSFPTRPHKMRTVLITCERTITVCISNIVGVINDAYCSRGQSSYGYVNPLLLEEIAITDGGIEGGIEGGGIEVRRVIDEQILTIDSHTVQNNGELRCGYPYFTRNSTPLGLTQNYSSRRWESRYIPIPKDTTCTAIDDFKFLCKYRR